jgi:putative FmdB family regulatory protein
MPLYEYECSACGHRFERIQKFSDPPVEECPNCGKKNVQKLMSSPAIQFKGSGWYITDYARAKESGKSKESGESKGSTESKESSASKDSKEPTTSKDSKESSKDAKTVPTPKASGE